MKLPRSVLVTPFTYSVHLVPSLPDGGNMDTEGQTILIQKEQADMSKRDSLLHETVHACLSQGMSQRLKEISSDLEEELVSILAPRTLGVLRDNPEFVQYLVEEEA